MQLKKKYALSIIGHRGFKKEYPENTLLSFQKAIEAGADYIEFDVFSSSDGVIVVCHDETTGRTGNVNYVIHDTPFEKLRTVDMGQGEKIPTLQEVINLCKGKIGLQIEIKEHGLADKVVEQIKKSEMQEDTCISSFIHSELSRVKEIDQKFACAALVPTKETLIKGMMNRRLLIDAAKRVHADALHPFMQYVNKQLVQNCVEAGLLINPWTVDDPKLWKKYREWGVSGIITNDPAGLRKMLNS
jgi:glycerophosphoryl diester phosphodiesterase